MIDQFNNQKIFGIGLSRTGTTSLHLALVLLGKASIHYPAFAVSRWMLGDFNGDLLIDFDSCSDIPAAIYFRELDKRYPNSKFILTTRDEQGWLNSTREWWKNCPPSNKNTLLRDMVRLAAYGSAVHSDDRFLKCYKMHLHQVREYFSSRQNSFLELDIEDKDKWGKLCSFLDLPKPNIDYPHIRSPKLGYFKEVKREDLLSKREQLMLTLSHGG